MFVRLSPTFFLGKEESNLGCDELVCAARKSWLFHFYLFSIFIALLQHLLNCEQHFFYLKEAQDHRYNFSIWTDSAEDQIASSSSWSNTTVFIRLISKRYFSDDSTIRFLSLAGKVLSLLHRVVRWEDLQKVPTKSQHDKKWLVGHLLQGDRVLKQHGGRVISLHACVCFVQLVWWYQWSRPSARPVSRLCRPSGWWVKTLGMKTDLLCDLDPAVCQLIHGLGRNYHSRGVRVRCCCSCSGCDSFFPTNLGRWWRSGWVWKNHSGSRCQWGSNNQLTAARKQENFLERIMALRQIQTISF